MHLISQPLSQGLVEDLCMWKLWCLCGTAEISPEQWWRKGFSEYLIKQWGHITLLLRWRVSFTTTGLVAGSKILIQGDFEDGCLASAKNLQFWRMFVFIISLRSFFLTHLIKRCLVTRQISCCSLFVHVPDLYCSCLFYSLFSNACSNAFAFALHLYTSSDPDRGLRLIKLDNAHIESNSIFVCNMFDSTAGS